MPAPSWPRTDGAFQGMVPSSTDRSEWHTPAATIFTLTSVGPGLGDLELVGDLGVLAGVDDPSHQAPFRQCRLRAKRSRSSVFSTLPLALVGRASTTSTWRGTL